MEQHQKHLKISSILLLLFTAARFLRVTTQYLFTDSGTAMLPDWSSEGLILATRIILVVVTLIVILPQTYVGVRGLRIAKKPTTTKGHIIWAYILVILSVLGLLETVSTIVQKGSLSGSAFALINGLLFVAIYFYYIISATAVAKNH